MKIQIEIKIFLAMCLKFAKFWLKINGEIKIMAITKKTFIEELVEKIPESVRYLKEKGIRCIICGEPTWGTLEDAAKEKGFSDKDIQKFVDDLNEFEIFN